MSLNDVVSPVLGERAQDIHPVDDGGGVTADAKYTQEHVESVVQEPMVPYGQVSL